MHRDFSRRKFPDNVLIVTHGVALRVFLMSFFRWTVEEFCALPDPDNCQYVTLRRFCEEDESLYRIDSDRSTYSFMLS